MKSNIYGNILDYLDEINSSIYRLSEIDDEQLRELSINERNEVIHLLNSLELMIIEGFKESIEESLENSEWDFEHCGIGNIRVNIEYEYIREDDDTVTYEFKIDRGGTVETIDISKEYLIEELSKGEKINDIILSEIECNSF